ncbi:MAG TPA: zf-HC2 domain-containing protein [Blastocatellia bacterium]|nr:zf-HC2 domain-containing protein [Blastocatellia bacterium]
MKCEKCRQYIEEYFDGEIESEIAAQVNSHVAACAGCAKYYEELGQEQELYARYQRDVEVTPALWAGVEARIKREKAPQRSRPFAGFRERLAGLFATPRFSPALAAALVIVAVGLTVLVMSLMNSRNNNQIAVQQAPPPITNPDNANRQADANEPKPEDKGDKLANNNAPGKPAPQKQLVATARPPQPKQVDPLQLVREAEQKYVRAIAILSRDVNRRRSQIDPMVLARFDNALTEIDRAINDTRRVVRENPDDPVALQYLLSAYAKKVDALREMAVD